MVPAPGTKAVPTVLRTTTAALLALSSLTAVPDGPSGPDPMSLEEKVGQLFVAQVYGTAADQTDVRNTRAYGVDTPAEVVARYHLGGVVYFADNITAPEQVTRFSAGLQAASGVPLLISVDQEYGRVARFGPPVTQFPGAMALGAAGDPALARQAAAVGGRELKALGVGLNYAPDADVNVNPANPVIGVRSFSSDPQLAADLTAAQVTGYQEAGIAATAKHFPGHGDTAVDSHTGIPVVGHTREEWERIDAPPFRAAVAAGVDVVMTGHIVVPSLDPGGTPATLSAPILTGLLREELGYDGVVTTDALNMAGVRQKFGDAEIPVLALKAGADQLLMPQDLETAYRAVLKAVRNGEISEVRIDRSVERILKLKKKVGAVEAAAFVPHTDEARAITDRTTTVVKNDASVLPFRRPPGTMHVTGSDGDAVRAFISEAVARGTRVTTEDFDVAVVLTRDGDGGPVVEQLLASGKPVVVVAVGTPYDILHLRDAPTYVATYSRQPVAVKSLARVLYGEVPPSGRLPVEIPGLFPLGHGITW
jgi:beta-N-acetylhexosaminidase